MKYSETGFRSLYKRFAVFELNGNILKCLEGFPRKRRGELRYRLWVYRP